MKKLLLLCLVLLSRGWPGDRMTMMKRLFLLLAFVTVGNCTDIFTVTQVAAVDCWAVGCGGRVHNGDTTIFTAWASSGSYTYEGATIPGALYGTTNDSDIYYNGGDSSLGPNCSGRSIVWLKIPAISVLGAGGTIYTKNCMNSFSTAPGDTAWAPAANGTCTSGFADACDWKSQGMICVDGVCYLHVQRQRIGDGTFAHDTTLIKSADQGATWLNPAHVGGTPNANGDAPAGPGDASYPASIMWPDGAAHNGISQKIGRLEFFTYGRDGAAWPNVDNNGTYLYALAYSGDFNSFYLARVVRANMANLSIADWSYYVCPGYSTTVCDGSDNANWSSTLASATAVQNTGVFGLGGGMYLSEIGTYVMTGGNIGKIAVRTAPHPWGPWTTGPVGDMSENPASLSPTQRMGFVSPILGSAVTISAGRTVQFAVVGTQYTYDSVSAGGTTAYVTYQIARAGVGLGLFPMPW